MNLYLGKIDSSKRLLCWFMYHRTLSAVQFTWHETISINVILINGILLCKWTINIPLKVARHFNHPLLRCRCTPGALAISVARTRLSKKARELAQRERNVCQTRISLSPPAAPKSFPDLSRGPGSIITRSRAHFCQSGPSRIMSCATCARAKKKKRKK